MLVTPLLLVLLRVLTGDLPAGPGAVTTAAVLLLTCAVTLALGPARLPVAGNPAAIHAAALRRRAYRTAYLPRATRPPGPPRPRAPGRAPAAA
ncbi:hypothetical protein [Kitasatospora cheerisanensis]|uniref:Uncharacterized protein n=1 Tax=Kitasatospora cheerisanensis KCTC 2395 TaxID=1348663 RepID=A0A066Z4S6_9ACTN|nr:hypothetical protein [Kitasatospora cheerisanensis]KDN85351.1 hypothetical protein KCH_29320 [Kitasatospora cheerisanensis KCTC 2395]